MSQHDSISDWDAIEQKLKQETKATLIQTLKELTAVSPPTSYFLRARYLHTQDIPARIKPYQQQIDAQFDDDMPSLDLHQVQQIVQNYQKATKDEEKGTAELWVYALEAAAGFINGMGMHDLTYQSDLVELAWECVYFLQDRSRLYSLYEERLQTIYGWLDEAGGEWLTEPLNQLEADMQVWPEDM